MGRVPQGFQILHVPGGTSYILRRTGPLSFQTLRDRHLGAVHDPHDDDVMLPIVAEVVLVLEHLPLVAEKFAQAPPPFVPHLRGVPGIGDPILLLSESEEMEMVVLPSHDLLDHAMEAGEGDRSGNQKAPPDRRQDLPQFDPELESHRCLDATFHDALLRGNI
jgi:hypothetical protein